jgi:hypothetical protein
MTNTDIGWFRRILRLLVACDQIFIYLRPQTTRAGRSLGCNAANVALPNRQVHRRIGTVVTTD